MTKLHLAGLTVTEFLHRHWQKKPLLARGALPGMGNFLRRDGLFELAARADLESRLVVRRGRAWQVRQGPFPPRTFARLRGTRWISLRQNWMR